MQINKIFITKMIFYLCQLQWVIVNDLNKFQIRGKFSRFIINRSQMHLKNECIWLHMTRPSLKGASREN